MVCRRFSALVSKTSVCTFSSLSVSCVAFGKESAGKESEGRWMSTLQQHTHCYPSARSTPRS